MIRISYFDSCFSSRWRILTPLVLSERSLYRLRSLPIPCFRGRGKSGKHGYVRRHDSPAFRQTHPDLALTAENCPRVYGALEFQGDAAAVPSECDDIKAADRAGDVGGRSASAKGADLVDAVEVLGDSESHGVR